MNNEEIWKLWSSSFREMVNILDARMDPYADQRARIYLESDSEWTRHGATDAQYFYNDLVRDREKILKLVNDEDWLATYFYMKYITY